MSLMNIDYENPQQNTFDFEQHRNWGANPQ